MIAAVVELLDRTLIRVGNEEYARANGSFGLTTLRNRHVQVDGSHLRMHFAGKSNKQFDVRFDDPRLARIVTRCQDLPGQLLFQYVNGDGTPRPVRSSDVNDYVRDHSGLEATAKTFRTWNATVYTATALAAAPQAESAREGKSTVMAMLKVVSAELNNTPAVCRRSYIHPAVIDTYLDGTLADRWADASHADLDSSPPRSGRLCRCSNAAVAERLSDCCIRHRRRRQLRATSLSPRDGRHPCGVGRRPKWMPGVRGSMRGTWDGGVAYVRHADLLVVWAARSSRSGLRT